MKCLLIITALLALSSPALAQEPAGGPVIDRIEARIEQVRDSLDGNSREMGRINDRLDRWEAIVDKWDGHRIAALWQAFSTAIVGLYRLVIELIQLAKWLVAAVIAVCVARTVRELSEAAVAWKPKPA